MAESIFSRARAGIAKAFARSAPEPALPKFEHGPSVGTVAAYNRRKAPAASHPWMDGRVSQIAQAITLAQSGQPYLLQDLYDDMMDRDARVSAVVRTRTLALTGKPYTIKPPAGFEQDPLAKEVADGVRDIIAGIPKWSAFVGYLADAIPRGFTVSEIGWGTNRRGWYVPVAIEWRHPNRFAFDDDLRVCLRESRSSGGSYGTPLDTLKPDGFVVHTPSAGRVTYATRGGALLPCIVPALAKKMGLKAWLKGSERYGVPLPVLRLPEGSEVKQADGLEILRKMNADWSVVLWGGIEIDKVVGTGEFTADVHQRLIEIANIEIAIAVLGQNLTTEVGGGSFAAATAHNFVRADLLAGDASEIDETIRSQLIERIVRFNWPHALDRIPVYETSLSTQQPVTLEDVKEGAFSENEYRGNKGYSAKADGTGDQYRKPPAPTFGQPFGASAPVSGGTPAALPLARKRQATPSETTIKVIGQT